MSILNYFPRLIKKKKIKHNFLSINQDNCLICGNNYFHLNNVLWKYLTDEWKLAAYEINYINKQQGLHCTKCKNNFRSLALANALMKEYNYIGLFKDFVISPTYENLKTLEINDCGNLNKYLSLSKNHIKMSYPEIDMQNMQIENETYDLILHSDTLEHVSDPVLAMKECLRVLKPNGKCIFTTPVVYGRKTRSRKGLPLCYHGGPTTKDMGYIVHTEFGDDIWDYLKDAGFSKVYSEILEFPAAIAYIGIK